MTVGRPDRQRDRSSLHRVVRLAVLPVLGEPAAHGEGVVRRRRHVSGVEDPETRPWQAACRSMSTARELRRESGVR